MIHYWDRDELYPCMESNALVRAVYRAHPPDTPFAWYGSTPGHLQNIFKALRFGPGAARVSIMRRRI
jgi:hypothetical protein